MFLFIKNNCLDGMFSNLCIVYRIYLSAALTNCSGEQYFSVLKRVKNYLRSTIVSNRLNVLALLNTENNMLQNINVSSVINNFSDNKARKTGFFLKINYLI